MESRTIDSRQRRSNQFGTLELLSVCGFALVFAWFFLTAFGLPLYFPPDSLYVKRFSPQAFFFLSAFLGMLIVRTKAQFFETSFAKVRMVAIFVTSASLMPLYAVFVLLDIFLYVPAISFVFALFAGAALIFFITAYEDIGGRMRVRAFIRFSGLATISGAILFLIVSLFVEAAFRSIFSTLFILLAGLLLTYADKKTIRFETEDFESMRSRFHLDMKISVLVFIFNIAFAIAMVYTLSLPSTNTYLAFAVGIVAVGIMMYSFRGGKRVKDDYIVTLMRVCIAVLAVAFVFLSLAPPIIQKVGLWAVIALWLIYWIATGGILLQHTVDFNLLIPYHTAPCKMASNAGFSVGWVCGIGLLSFPASSDGLGSLPSIALIVFAVVVLVGMLLLPLNRKSDASFAVLRDGETSTSPADEGDDYWLREGSRGTSLSRDKELELTCNRLADRYELSPREGEILFYLAKGRNAKYVANKITVSEHTARTHVYHIYKKMDVHSQQALIDLIEEHRQDHEVK